MAMWKFLILALLGVTPDTALALDLFPRDASCVHELTVQHQNCTVKTYFLCGEGQTIVRAEEVQPDKPRIAMLYDHDLALIIAGDALGLTSTYPVGERSALLDWESIFAGGQSNYEMELALDMFGLTRTGPYSARVKLGAERLTVSGIELVPLQEDADWVLPQPVGTISGSQTHYVSAELDFPIFGEGSSSIANNGGGNGNVPVEILFPGEQGFDSEQPKHGCDGLSSLFPLDLERPA
jgi:hypothetical protein